MNEEQALEELRQKVEIIAEAWAEFGLAIAENLGAAMESFIRIWDEFRRDILRVRLRRWLPERPAAWIAERCPRRWLPNPEID